MTFRRQAGRLLATIDRTLLDADFRLTAQVIAVAAPPSAVVGDAAPGGDATSISTVPAVGDELASGALRLQQVGDSLVVSEFTGWTGQGELHYRRRGAIPVLQVLAGKGVVVDAAPLWATLDPDALDGGGSAGRAHRLGPAFSAAPVAAPARPFSRAGAPAPRRDAAAVVQRFGGRAVTYAVAADRLPKVPMRPRIADSRIPWFIGQQPLLWIDSTSSRMESTRFSAIRRYRLEKQNAAAAVADVRQPILADLSGVPERWVPYFTAALEDWNRVFASIGLRGAIRVLPPGESLPADSAIPVMKLSFEENGGVSTGKMIRTDPRSNEVLETRVIVGSGSLNFVKFVYRALCAARDPRITPRAPLPVSIAGMALRSLVSHEVGHALGFPHNFQVDGYQTDSLRRPDFVHRMSSAPSVMSYSSLNYVAQPDDHVPLEDLVLRPGPYDAFALGWGYRPIPKARTPAEELPTLERWRSVQDRVAYLRGQVNLDNATGITTGDAKFPYYGKQVLGNDLLKSLGYGVHNLGWTAETQKSKSAFDSYTGYGLLTAWMSLVPLVPSLIGGQRPRAPFPREVSRTPLDPIDSAYQVQAARFVLSRLLYGQDELVRQLIPAPPPAGDSTVVLFGEVLPEWEKSPPDGAASTKQALQQFQARVLGELIETQMPLLVEQKQVGTLAGVCRELVTAERRLAAAAADPKVTPESREHANALSAIVAKVFKPLEQGGDTENAESAAAKASSTQPLGPLCTK